MCKIQYTRSYIMQPNYSLSGGIKQYSKTSDRVSSLPATSSSSQANPNTQSFRQPKAVKNQSGVENNYSYALGRYNDKQSAHLPSKTLQTETSTQYYSPPSYEDSYPLVTQPVYSNLTSINSGVTPTTNVYIEPAGEFAKVTIETKDYTFQDLYGAGQIPNVLVNPSQPLTSVDQQFAIQPQLEMINPPQIIKKQALKQPKGVTMVQKIISDNNDPFAASRRFNADYTSPTNAQSDNHTRSYRNTIYTGQSGVYDADTHGTASTLYNPDTLLAQETVYDLSAGQYLKRSPTNKPYRYAPDDYMSALYNSPDTSYLHDDWAVSNVTQMPNVDHQRQAYGAFTSTPLPDAYPMNHTPYPDYQHTVSTIRPNVPTRFNDQITYPEYRHRNKPIIETDYIEQTPEVGYQYTTAEMTTTTPISDTNRINGISSAGYQPTHNADEWRRQVTDAPLSDIEPESERRVIPQSYSIQRTSQLYPMPSPSTSYSYHMPRSIPGSTLYHSYGTDRDHYTNTNYLGSIDFNDSPHRAEFGNTYSGRPGTSNQVDHTQEHSSYSHQTPMCNYSADPNCSVCSSGTDEFINYRTQIVGRPRSMVTRSTSYDKTKPRRFCGIW